ncbi:MAG: GNAT family N-acetyltransferase [Acidobacteriaceae bacterium]
MLSPLNIRPFNGDFNSLASLMQDSWSENREQPLFYSAQYLRSYLTAPGANSELMPAAMAEEELVGFIAGMPRAVRNHGRGESWALSCFLTVARERKKLGIGPMLWGELLRRCRAAGMDGMISYCVEGDPMNRMVEALGRILEFPTRRVFTLEFMARPLTGLTPTQTQAPPSPEAAGALLGNFANALCSERGFVRQWTPEESQWHCVARLGVITSIGKDSRGMLCGAVADVQDREAIAKCLFIDDVFWGDLDQHESAQMLSNLLAQAHAAGAVLAICPLAGYIDYAPLRTAGFRRTKRRLHMYLTSWSDALPLQPLSSAYIDVF